MTQATLYSLSGMIGSLDPNELAAAERMIAARHRYLTEQMLLTIPVGAEVTFQDGEERDIGRCYRHNRQSIVVVLKDGGEVRVVPGRILEVNGEPWYGEAE